MSMKQVISVLVAALFAAVSINAMAQAEKKADPKAKAEQKKTDGKAKAAKKTEEKKAGK